MRYSTSTISALPEFICNNFKCFLRTARGELTAIFFSVVACITGSVVVIVSVTMHDHNSMLMISFYTPTLYVMILILKQHVFYFKSNQISISCFFISSHHNHTSSARFTPQNTKAVVSSNQTLCVCTYCIPPYCH